MRENRLPFKAGWTPPLPSIACLAASLHVALLLACRLPRSPRSVAVLNPGRMEAFFSDEAPPATPAAGPAPATPQSPPPEPPATPVAPLTMVAPPPAEALPERLKQESAMPAHILATHAPDIHATPARQGHSPIPRALGTASSAARVHGGSTRSPAPVPASSASGNAEAPRVANGPQYIVRPAPLYPPEAKMAREQGMVLLRITVDPEGRPIAVVLVRSSGFPRLDHAALEAGWRCRLQRGAPGLSFEAPVRFNLQR